MLVLEEHICCATARLALRASLGGMADACRRGDIIEKQASIRCISFVRIWAERGVHCCSVEKRASESRAYPANMVRA